MKAVWRKLVGVLLLFAVAFLAVFLATQMQLTDGLGAASTACDQLRTHITGLIQQLQTADEESRAAFSTTIRLVTDVEKSISPAGTPPSAVATTRRTFARLRAQLANDSVQADARTLRRAASVHEITTELNSLTNEIRSLSLLDSAKPGDAQQLLRYRWINAAYATGARLLSPWTALILLLIIVTLYSDRFASRARAVAKHFSSFKLGPGGIELTRPTARDVETMNEGVTRIVADYRQEVAAQYRKLVNRHKLLSKAKRVVELAAPSFRSSDLNELRCTIHISDPLFGDSLRQLLDYDQGDGTADRSWSARRGFIGRVWRLNASEVTGHVDPDPKKLVSEWGMTLREAEEAGHGRRSFLGVILRDAHGDAAAIFYLDHMDEYAFVENDDQNGKLRLLRCIESLCRDVGLTKCICKVLNKADDFNVSPRLHV